MNDNNTNNPSPSFFDSKMILAVVLIGVFYFGWNKYLNSKYPNMNAKKEQAAATAPAATTPNTTAAATTTDEAKEPATPEAQTLARYKPAQMLSYEDDKVRFQVSSEGMAIYDFQSKNYFDRKNEPVHLTAQGKPVFSFVWGHEVKPLHFDITQDKNQFKGVAQVAGFTIERIMTYDSESYSFTQEIKISNPQSVEAQYQLTSQDKIVSPESKSWLFPSYEHQDLLTFVKGRKEAINLSHASTSEKKEFKALNLYSIGTQYFTTGLLDNSPVLPDLTFTSDVNSKSIVHNLVYAVPKAVETVFKQSIFIGPKSSENLKAANENFIDLLDYGMLSWISKPMLYVMKWFHGIVGNWGIAIILLTLLVRALVLPFNLMSYKSMKGMQTIQPMLTSLREKYKDDPVTLNREMMAVMKQNNANPLAGCLPMLLQIPIFFALYKVIGSSVELYQAPFYLWIQDLSLHDKFYALPILMGITMYIQQKLTPSTLDPMQARILAFMPILFSVFMLNLPAGLTLYMFVSAVFGIIQQKTFMTLMK